LNIGLEFTNKFHFDFEIRTFQKKKKLNLKQFKIKYLCLIQYDNEIKNNKFLI